MSDNKIGNIFQGLFGRKTEDTPATPQERASKTLEGYDIDLLKKQALVDKLATFEEAADEAKADSNADIEAAQDLIKKAEADAKKANDTVNAAKAVGLRTVTLSKEIQAARKVAEMAKEEAKTKVEALEKATKESSDLGAQLIAGLTDPRFDLDAILRLSDEEVQDLFGSEPKVQEPKVQEPKVQEPKVQEPKVQEPKVQVAKVQM